MTLQDIPELQRLSREEKLQLIADLWDDLTFSGDALPVSEEEKRLLEEHTILSQDPAYRSLTWEEFESRVRQRP